MTSLSLAGFILLVIGITVLAVKAGAVALRLTGLDEDRAFFQALSAFTGTGFTTRESELIVADPRRRKIVGALMILGNVVLVTVISLMVGSFATVKGWLAGLLTPIVLVVGSYVLYRILMTRTVAKRWSDWVGEALANRLRLKTRGLHEVLTLAEGHGVAEIGIEAGSPAAGKTLAEAGLRQAGLLVLAIRQGEHLIPSPTAEVRIQSGDRLVCYGELVRMTRFAEGTSRPTVAGGGSKGGANRAATEEKPPPDIVSLRIPDERGRRGGPDHPARGGADDGELPNAKEPPPAGRQDA